jgi:hypothetical protein
MVESAEEGLRLAEFFFLASNFCGGQDLKRDLGAYMERV